MNQTIIQFYIDMHFDKNNTPSLLLVKFSLLLSLFLFTGYNSLVSAAPLDAVKIELLLSERTANAYQLASNEKSISNNCGVISLFSNSIEEEDSRNYNHNIVIVLKTQTKSYYNYKIQKYYTQISRQAYPNYPGASKPSNVIG